MILHDWSTRPCVKHVWGEPLLPYRPMSTRGVYILFDWIGMFYEFLRPGRGLEGGIEAAPRPAGGGEMPTNPMVRILPHAVFVRWGTIPSLPLPEKMRDSLVVLQCPYTRRDAVSVTQESGTRTPLPLGPASHNLQFLLIGLLVVVPVRLAGLQHVVDALCHVVCHMAVGNQGGGCRLRYPS